MRAYRFRVVVLLTVLCGFIIGCGPSQNDLIMRAANRKRPKDDDEGTPPPAPPKQDVADASSADAPLAKTPSVETPTTVAPPPSARAAARPKDDAPDPEPKKEEEPGKPMIALEERKKTLSADERRQMAQRGMIAIAEAIEAYKKDHGGRTMKRFNETPSGLPGLSWRVELLPYLGYKELHGKFDFGKPWYMEPNKSLLQYIPDEYISPERFDTMTNIQVPAHRSFLFGLNRGMAAKDIEDGPDQTIMLVEVNDDLAVEWTAPEDFLPDDVTRMTQYLGDVRGDGIFAVWGNGWPTMLAKQATDSQLKAAFTYESGDERVMAKIHRPMSIEGVSDASVKTAKKVGAQTAVNSEPAVVVADPVVPPQPVINRDAVPIEADIQKSMERLRKVFAAKLREAKTDEEKRELGNEMLASANAMTTDAAGAYALSRGAQRIASDCGSADLLIDAIDQRVGRFEVDALEENLSGMIEFSEATAKRKPDSLEGREEYVSRSVNVIFAAIMANDFVRAQKITRTASKYTDPEGESVPKLLNKLRGHLGGAQASYDEAREHLVSMRINPDDDVAASKFGQFLCFIKGDWANGLPLLTRSSNANLARVAQMDLDGVSTVDEQVALGDTWWELSRRASGVYRQAAEDRAKVYYEMAVKVMPESLDKMHVNNQLREMNDKDPSSPISLCRAIADKVGADLETSLAGIAVKQIEVKQNRYPDDDDDD